MFYKTRNPFDRDVTRDKYTKNSDSAVSRINPTTCIQQSVWNTESLQAVFRISCFLYQCFFVSAVLCIGVFVSAVSFISVFVSAVLLSSVFVFILAFRLFIRIPYDFSAVKVCNEYLLLFGYSLTSD